MLLHYLKNTFRHFSIQKFFSLINLVGLAVALSVVYFTLLYINFELSYDQFNTHANRIYRISTDIQTNHATKQETSAAPLASKLAVDIPEIAQATRVFLDYYIVQKDVESYGEETLAYADSSIFNVFSFPLLKGTPNSVFRTPYSLVISETAAMKYFGTTDCINQQLILDGNIKATITGIMRDIPQNSHLRTEMFLSMSSLINENSTWMEDWNRYGFYTYVLLKDHVDPQTVKQKIQAFSKQYPSTSPAKHTLVMEALTDLYLQGSNRGNKAGSSSIGNYQHLYIFSIIACLVLCIACFNHTNISFALVLKRIKEFGIKRVVGASPRQVVGQLLSDAIFLSGISFIGALLLCLFFFPWFEELIGKQISFRFIEQAKYIGITSFIALVAGILSNMYPALFVLKIKFSAAVKGKYNVGKANTQLRNTLSGIQFMLFIGLSVATLIIYKQLSFMKNENLGFRKSHNLVIDFHYDNRILEHLDRLRQELSAIPGVNTVSFSSTIPGKPTKTFNTQIETQQGQQELRTDAYFIDYGFLSQYGIDLLAGRAFNKTFPADLRNAMIINETAAKAFGFDTPAAAIGKRFRQRGSSGEIIGVVKDFHFRSMHDRIQPLTMQISPGFFTFITINISSQHIAAKLKAISSLWEKRVPDLPLVHFFADDAFNQQYIQEERFSKFFTCLSLLAILISSMGLLGLISLNTASRTKEIGIRKVLGASSQSVYRLLVKEYLILTVIAFAVVCPITWLVMQKWLQNFVYHTGIPWWIFPLVGILSTCLTLLIISFQAIKASISNPIDSLRSE